MSPQAYVSPMLVNLAGRRQILVVSASRVFGLAPENGVSYGVKPGTRIWASMSRSHHGGQESILYFFRVWQGASLVEVTSAGNSFTAAVLGKLNMKNKFNSSVLHEGHVYGLDEGILTCVDVNTGVRSGRADVMATGRYSWRVSLDCYER